MPLTAQALASWSLPTALPRGPATAAARELRHHLGRFGVPVRSAGEVEIVAGDSATDGFSLELSATRLTVRGDNPRGCLNGVYWLLEQLGFAWVEPGEGGSRFVPSRQLAEGHYRQEPAFARRTLILGNDALHDAWPAWLEWASRNRLNDIFFHDTPPSRLHRGPALRPTTAGEIASDDGARDARYNLCVSHEGAVAHLRRSARAFFQRFGGADIYHLWADDIRGGGWCECGGCAAMSPSDQALFATNILAEVLAEAAQELSQLLFWRELRLLAER